METFIIAAYVSSVIVTVLMFVGALAVLAGVDAGLPERWQRYRLGRLLGGTRLHAVLIRLGIRPQQYMQETDVRVLARQIRQCEDCRAHQECDYAINGFGMRLPISTCANRMSLPR